jgi:5'-3' exonuclease
MSYYYHSVPSWEWYYTYKYAPRIVDLIDLDKLSIEFERGVPLGVYEFAMLILPSFSYRVVPYPYQVSRNINV